MKHLLYILGFAFICMACSNTSNLPDLDLMSKGIPLKIKAPENAIVAAKDMGIFKDVTIRTEDGFYLQITAGTKFQNDEAARKSEELNTIKQLNNFSRIVAEDENGFLFEKKQGDDLSYDFRRIRIQGDDEYLFQTGLIGKFTLEQVETMFEATKR